MKDLKKTLIITAIIFLSVSAYAAGAERMVVGELFTNFS